MGLKWQIMSYTQPPVKLAETDDLQTAQMLREANDGWIKDRDEEADLIAALPADSFSGRLRDWRDRQGFLEAQVAKGDMRSWEDWQKQNAAAVALLKESADVLMQLAIVHPGGFYDEASKFTCGEADSIADLIGLVNGDKAKDTFLALHAEGDDEGDSHFELRQDEVTY